MSTEVSLTRASEHLAEAIEELCEAGAMGVAGFWMRVVGSVRGKWSVLVQFVREWLWC